MTTNYWAILLCAVLNAVLGMSWYGAFRLPWMSGHGLTPEALQSMENPYMPYLVGMLGAIVMAYATTLVFRRLGVCTLKEGILYGMALGLFGLVGTIVMNLYALNTFILSLIDGGFHFVELTVFGAVIGSWVKKS